MTHLTRTDCKRDNVKVYCPNATLLGFGLKHCKRGYWVVYETDNHKHVGRAIGRVTCEGKVYIELATASESFSSAFIRWVDPLEVREVRRAAPKRVFDFFADDAGWQPGAIFRALEHGVSDLPDQLQAIEKQPAFSE